MVRRPERPLPRGKPVFVRDRDGKPVGVGFYNSRSELALRMLSRHPVADIPGLLRDRLDNACDLRDRLLNLPAETDGYRLAHAEGDGLPGLVLDRLGETIVAQIFAQCAMEHIETIGERLLERYPGCGLVLTIDPESAAREGIDPLPPLRSRATTVTEHEIRYQVHPGTGHKTGFFADQRDNRLRVRHLSEGRRVLDLCCNSGGFAMAASRGGAADVVAVDLDEKAVEQARHNAESNQMRIRVEHGDAFNTLRDTAPGRHDLIVLDPPKWALGKAALDEALVKYTDLNHLALTKLSKGGILVTSSCSGALSENRFHAILAQAAANAGKDVRILHAGGAGPDHPIALECPETRYLKSVFLEIR